MCFKNSQKQYFLDYSCLLKFIHLNGCHFGAQCDQYLNIPFFTVMCPISTILGDYSKWGMTEQSRKLIVKTWSFWNPWTIYIYMFNIYQINLVLQHYDLENVPILFSMRVNQKNSSPAIYFKFLTSRFLIPQSCSFSLK